MKKQFVSILAGATLFGLTAFAGCSVDVTKYNRYDNADKYTAGSFTYAATGITDIDIDWVVGSVTLVQSDNAELSVSESGASLSEDEKVHYWIDRGTLNIKFCKSGWKGNLDDKEKNLTVEIPQGVDLDVDNVSGKIVAENVSVGELSVENVSGNVTLGNVIARELSVENVSGGIQINGLTAGDISIDGVSGSIELSELSAPKAEIETVSGKITLTLAPSQGANVSFDSASGKLKSEKKYSKNGDNYSFAGEGDILQVEAETSSGDFIVK